MQQPLAVAIIAGMLLQLPLVLLVMPVLYALLHRRGKATPPASTAPAPAG
jgi:Cu/Ag efflux pump CusA